MKAKAIRSLNMLDDHPNFLTVLQSEWEGDPGNSSVIYLVCI